MRFGRYTEGTTKMPRAPFRDTDTQAALKVNLEALDHNTFRAYANDGEMQTLLMMRILYTPPDGHIANMAILNSLDPADYMALLKKAMGYIISCDPSFKSFCFEEGNLESFVSQLEELVHSEARILNEVSGKYEAVGDRDSCLGKIKGSFGPNVSTVADHVAEAVWELIHRAHKPEGITLESTIESVKETIRNSASNPKEAPINDRRVAELENFCKRCRPNYRSRSRNATENARIL